MFAPDGGWQDLLGTQQILEARNMVETGNVNP